MTKQKCMVCGVELKCGTFGYRQTTCWDCFREKYLDICSRYEIKDEDQELLNHMMGIVAERFGCKW